MNTSQILCDNLNRMRPGSVLFSPGQDNRPPVLKLRQTLYFSSLEEPSFMDRRVEVCLWDFCRTILEHIKEEDYSWWVFHWEETDHLSGNITHWVTVNQKVIV